MKQITLPAVSLEVQDAGTDDDVTKMRALIIHEFTPTPGGPLPGDTFVIPMPAELAEKVGNMLAAPHIEVAPASALHVVGKQ